MTPSASCLTPTTCVLQPRHISFEPAWAILEHELAAQIHITMKQYFHKLKEMEPDNAFRPDTLVSHCCCVNCSNHPTSIAVGTCSCPSVICVCTKVQPCCCDYCAFRQLAHQECQPTKLPTKQFVLPLFAWLLVFNLLPAFDADHMANWQQQPTGESHTVHSHVDNRHHGGCHQRGPCSGCSPVHPSPPPQPRQQHHQICSQAQSAGCHPHACA